ncbi:flavodoxin/nitric oxide synthase [Nitratireductor aquibiodomus RA22]|uniref:Flavodoxin/nitric oxide synthase n=1 Tax=Nitratireductor aquibiodomus RA22 TaxID=1189611 RepID=I5C561_9HYPH|nr:flavodoxin family protein [Nitratireductor aquibiodomus]EIM76963.1 flavodoxin/nitric oxide synthase [Nitratireductor aquibiodomus RA22]
MDSTGTSDKDGSVEPAPPAPTTRIAIVYHSGYGHTARQAEAVAAGIRQVRGVGVLLLTTDEAQMRWEELNAVQAIVFGAPTYVGAGSASFKAFQEASSNAIMAKGYLWKDKIAAGFTNSGTQSGDKLSTLLQMALFAAQHGMHWVNLDLPPANCSSTGSDEDLNRLGFWLGAAAQSNVDHGPDLAPPEADLATARHLGQRVASVALQFTLGREPALATLAG